MTDTDQQTDPTAEAATDDRDPILDDADAMRAAYLEMCETRDAAQRDIAATRAVMKQADAAAAHRTRNAIRQRNEAKAAATAAGAAGNPKLAKELAAAKAQVTELSGKLRSSEAARADLQRQNTTLVNSRRWRITEGLSRVFHTLTLGLLRPRKR